MSTSVPRIEQQQPCYLLKLPPELRLAIYEFTFPTLRPRINFSRKRASLPHKVTIDRPLKESHSSLLTVCRQINQEAAPVYYGLTTFVPMPWDDGQIARCTSRLKSLRNFTAWKRMCSIIVFVEAEETESMEAIQESMWGSFAALEKLRHVNQTRFKFFGYAISQLHRMPEIFESLECPGIIELSRDYGDEEAGCIDDYENDDENDDETGAAEERAAAAFEKLRKLLNA